MSRLFISYARRDLPTAERIYHDLTAAGHLPWLDKYDLAPGSKWRPAITKVIGECDFFLALLTRHSLGKRGYVQMELRAALEILQLYPGSKRFLIPLRLEECYPEDERLLSLHWADLFPSYQEGLTKVVRFLGRPSRRRRKPQRPYSEYGIEIPSDIQRWSDGRLKEWVERELWPMLIDRARRAYEYVEVRDYVGAVHEYAKDLLTATARENGFLAAYERAMKDTHT